MFDVLKILYNSKYAKLLWFKWWTALYFFYELDRFSVDLDFDIIKKLSLEEIWELKQELFIFLNQQFSYNKNIKLSIDWNLKNSFRFVLQYWWIKKLKLEFTSRIYDNRYESKRLFGLNVQVMQKEYMFAHKLCAFVSRYKQKELFVNRDLFDINYFLNLGILPNEKILQIRSIKLIWYSTNTKDFYKYIYELILHNKQRINANILDGLWELVDEKKKFYMKNIFVDELLWLLEFSQK